MLHNYLKLNKVYILMLENFCFTVCSFISSCKNASKQVLGVDFSSKTSKSKVQRNFKTSGYLVLFESKGKPKRPKRSVSGE